MTKKVAVVQNAIDPEPVEVIAAAVIKVAEGFQAISNSRLTTRAVLVLLQDATRLSRRDIESVLYHGARLQDYYIKKAPAK